MQEPGREHLSQLSIWTRANQHIMTAAPLAPAACGLIAGICLRESFNVPAWAFATTLFLFLSGTASKPLRFALAAPIAFGLSACVGGLLCWNSEKLNAFGNVAAIISQRDAVVRLRGLVVSEPIHRTNQDDDFATWRVDQESTAFLLRVHSFQSESGWTTATGTLRTNVGEAVLDVSEGDSVEAFGRLSALKPARNPGSFDWRTYFRHQGIDAHLNCDQRENIVRLGREGPSIPGWLRNRARGLLTDDISTTALEESSLLEAMVLGHRSRFDRRLNDIFTRAGCVHFIAASGSNIVVLMSVVWVAGRLFGLERRRCAWFMIGAIVLYGLVAEPRPPILRACIMGILFCGALLLQRPSSHLNWIALAAIFLCFISPLTVYDVGFQLSFVAVLGVTYVAPTIMRAGADLWWWIREDALGDRYLRADLRLRKIAEQFAPVGRIRLLGRSMRSAMRAIVLLSAVSAGAWLATAPITSLWFQQVQPWGVLSSVVVYPLVSLIMVLGILKAAFVLISPAVSGLIQSALSVIDSALVAVVEWFASLPGTSWTMPSPPWWLVLAYYVSIIAFVLFVRCPGPANSPIASSTIASGIRPKQQSLRIWLLGSLATFLIAGSVWKQSEDVHPALKVHVLAVGAGSATVLQMPTGETLVYDAGSMSAGNLGRNVVTPFLRFLGVNKIDRLYISHPNLDHFSGVPELLNQIPIDQIIWNHCFEPLSPPNSPAAELIRILQLHNVHVQPMNPSQISWDFGGVLFEALWPPSECAELSANDSSSVMRLTYGSTSILFTGDIELHAEKALIDLNRNEADILILPHHGSVCSATGIFLASVDAQALIRSSGQRTVDTTNGLPELVGTTRMLNTADFGAIRIVIEPDGFRIEPWMVSSN